MKKFSREEVTESRYLVVRIENQQDDKTYLKFCGYHDRKPLKSEDYPIGRRLGMQCSMSYYLRDSRYTIISLDLLDIEGKEKVDIVIKIPKNEPRKIN